MPNRTMLKMALVSCLALLVIAILPAVAFADTTSDYLEWVDSYGSDTPHNGFTTTSAKCAVCHSVHKAAADGQLLLRTTSEDACVYCHISSTTGLIGIYDGDTSLYTDDNKNNHSLAGGAPCIGCHSVHGADTYTGKIASKILKRLPIQPEFVRMFSETSDAEYLYTLDTNDTIVGAPPYDWEEWGGAKEVQQSAFCTGCHPYFTRASEDEITTSRMMVNGEISTDTTSFASHPMKRYWGDAAMNIDFVAEGSSLPTSTQVAGMSTNGCYRCHGEGDYTNLGPGAWESSFPHFTATRQRFLISSDTDGNWIDTPDSSSDGTCFHCHAAYTDIDGNPAGVGISY